MKSLALLLWSVALIIFALLIDGQTIPADDYVDDESPTPTPTPQPECENIMDASSQLPSYQWAPKAKHPCTIERISHQEFLRRFGPRGLPPMFPAPLVIASSATPVTSNTPSHHRNQEFRGLTKLETISNFFPAGFNITLSSSNSFSEHRKSLPLADYLNDLSKQDTTPDQLSNETWYFFGETYSSEWKQLLEHYEIPICHACVKDDRVALSFGIGNRGSGVQWHVHGPGFAETIWGQKHWVLQKNKPDFHPDQTSRNWMEYTYTQLTLDQRPLECTLDPGDILYFPNMWYHCTINLDPYTAFVSTFTQEHLFVEEEEEEES